MLPQRFYSHLSPGLRECLSGQYDEDYHDRYWKMGLVENCKVAGIVTNDVVRLLPSNVEEIRAFYAVHYPGNWFDPRMLESLQTFGIYASQEDYQGSKQPPELIAIAGVHVFSKLYQVAALGNIAVHAAHRGKGLARRVTAALVNSLLGEEIQHIGLNVSASNTAAIACYRRLGFEKIGEYDEVMWTTRE